MRRAWTWTAVCLIAAAAACAAPAVEPCGEAGFCPAGARCVAGECLAEPAACPDFAEGTPCAGDAPGERALCIDGRCQASRCGDGFADQAHPLLPEACDDGAANDDRQPDRCRSDCTPARCGDRVLDQEEALGCLEPPATLLILTIDPPEAALAIADLDGNGRQELLTWLPGAGAAELRVHFGEPGGFLTVPVELAAPPEDVALGDLDGDGDLDLVAVHGASVSIALATGPRAFAAASAHANPVFDSISPRPAHVGSGDFDGDGRDDVIVAAGGKIARWTSLADGTPGAVTALDSAPVVGLTVFESGLGSPAMVALVDAQFDLPAGHLRLLVGEETTSRTLVTLPAPLVEDPVATDLDGDGDHDLVVIDAQQNLAHVQLLDLTGTVETGFAADLPLPPHTATAGDLDGDGFTDLIIADAAGGLAWLRHQNAQLTTAGRVTGELPPVALAAAELDGDGFTDLVILGDGVAASVRRGGDGPLGPPRPLPLDHKYVASDIGDLDGDGHPDIVLIENSEFTTLLSRGNGAFVPVDSGIISLFGSTTGLLGDLTGDGRLDLVQRRQVIGLELLAGLGDGSFEITPTQVEPVGSPSALAIADLDGDGRDELVGFLAGAPARLISVTADDTGQLQPPTTLLEPLTDVVDHVLPVDLDGDGLQDLLLAGDQLRLARGQGGGAVAAPVTLADADYLFASAGDVDGDGDLDLVALTNSRIDVLLADGGAFTVTTSIARVGVDASLGLADLDGDGLLDLIVAEGALLGLGGGAFSTVMSHPTWPPSPLLRVADLDWDGVPDLLGLRLGQPTTWQAGRRLP